MKTHQNREGPLSWDDFEAGNFVSADQYVVNTLGWPFLGYVREASHNQFHGGTLFHDAATGLIWAENQVSLGAGETLMAKERFEQWLWELAAAETHHLHSDNGIFNAELFVEDCKNKFQTQSFSGVGAHHQNALAERSIQTIMYMTRTLMVHISLH